MFTGSVDSFEPLPFYTTGGLHFRTPPPGTYGPLNQPIQFYIIATEPLRPRQPVVQLLHKDCTTMLRILVLLIIGIGVGVLLRGRPCIKATKWSIQITVCLLLFVFGVSIGSNRDLIDNLYNFGWQAMVIACLGVAGSIVAAWVAQRLFLKKGGKS